ncbi:MAG: hypothetical protein HYS55_00880, partial [Candidatus Omnitrophica bacterium]|nr:hypothetical protein [Candidatus Omnitrophota bacterium]
MLQKIVPLFLSPEQFLAVVQTLQRNQRQDPQLPRTLPHPLAFLQGIPVLGSIGVQAWSNSNPSFSLSQQLFSEKSYSSIRSEARTDEEDDQTDVDRHAWEILKKLASYFDTIGRKRIVSYEVYSLESNFTKDQRRLLGRAYRHLGVSPRQTPNAQDDVLGTRYLSKFVEEVIKGHFNSSNPYNFSRNGDLLDALNALRNNYSEHHTKENSKSYFERSALLWKLKKTFELTPNQTEILSAIIFKRLDPVKANELVSHSSYPESQDDLPYFWTRRHQVFVSDWEEFMWFVNRQVERFEGLKYAQFDFHQLQEHGAVELGDWQAQFKSPGSVAERLKHSVVEDFHAQPPFVLEIIVGEDANKLVISDVENDRSEARLSEGRRIQTVLLAFLLGVGIGFSPSQSGFGEEGSSSFGLFGKVELRPQEWRLRERDQRLKETILRAVDELMKNEALGNAYQEALVRYRNRLEQTDPTRLFWNLGTLAGVSANPDDIVAVFFNRKIKSFLDSRDPELRWFLHLIFLKEASHYLVERSPEGLTAKILSMKLAPDALFPHEWLSHPKNIRQRVSELVREKPELVALAKLYIVAKVNVERLGYSHLYELLEKWDGSRKGRFGKMYERYKRSFFQDFKYIDDLNEIVGIFRENPTSFDINHLFAQHLLAAYARDPKKQGFTLPSMSFALQVLIEDQFGGDWGKVVDTESAVQALGFVLDQRYYLVDKIRQPYSEGTVDFQVDAEGNPGFVGVDLLEEILKSKLSELTRDTPHSGAPSARPELRTRQSLNPTDSRAEVRYLKNGVAEINQSAPQSSSEAKRAEARSIPVESSTLVPQATESLRAEARGITTRIHSFAPVRKNPQQSILGTVLAELVKKHIELETITQLRIIPKNKAEAEVVFDGTTLRQDFDDEEGFELITQKLVERAHLTDVSQVGEIEILFRSEARAEKKQKIFYFDPSQNAYAFSPRAKKVVMFVTWSLFWTPFIYVYLDHLIRQNYFLAGGLAGAIGTIAYYVKHMRAVTEMRLKIVLSAVFTGLAPDIKYRFRLRSKKPSRSDSPSRSEGRIRPASRAEVRGGLIVVADKMDERKLGISGVVNVSSLSKEEKLSRIVSLKPEVLIVRSTTKVDRSLIDRLLPEPKFIIRAGHGLDNVDVTYARLKGVKGIFGTGGAEDSVAALAMRMVARAEQVMPVSEDEAPALFFTIPEWMKALEKKIESESPEKQPLLRQKAEELFQPIGKATIESLKGRTIGVIGFGTIGKRIASVAKELGMKVLVYSPTLEKNPSSVESLGYQFATKEEIYQSAHYIVLITGLYKDGPRKNIGMVDQNAVDAMLGNPHLFALINPDREGLVDEEAIARLLRERPLVHYLADEVPEDKFLQEHALYTPHIGASTAQAEEKVVANTAQILERVFRDISQENFSTRAEARNERERIIESFTEAVKLVEQEQAKNGASDLFQEALVVLRARRGTVQTTDDEGFERDKKWLLTLSHPTAQEFFDRAITRSAATATPGEPRRSEIRSVREARSRRPRPAIKDLAEALLKLRAQFVYPGGNITINYSGNGQFYTYFSPKLDEHGFSKQEKFPAELLEKLERAYRLNPAMSGRSLIIRSHTAEIHKVEVMDHAPKEKKPAEPLSSVTFDKKPSPDLDLKLMVDILTKFFNI